MVPQDLKSKRIIQRRIMIVKEAFRAKGLSATQLFIDAVNFVEEGLSIAQRRNTLKKKN